MAPPPEYDKEPKAPDKSAATIVNEVSNSLHCLNDQQINSDHKPTNTATNSDLEKNKVDDSVENLDDGRLRALLDEAITYKCPKDREGKSDLFKNLLEAAEQQDDQASEAATRGLSSSRNTRVRGAGRRSLAHSNSLQDLVAALAAEPTPRRHRHPPAPAPVSARATQGGSLPSGVDTSFLLGEEPGTTRAGYLATVRCVNPPPLAERRVSASDANPPPDEAPHRRSKPVFPMTYTARATLEIGSGSVCSGRAVTTTTASNQGDSAIPFSCITTPEVVASCNTTTSSTPQATVAVDPKPLQLGSCYRAVASLTGAAPAAAPPPAPAPPPDDPATALLQCDVVQPRSVLSSTYNGLTLARSYGATAAADDYKKSLDENGNAVQGFSSPVSGSNQHKKPRRKKSSKNETVITSHQIDGYQGNKDLNEVLRFIESNAEHGRGAKLARAKHKDDCDDKAGKKRSTERRKDKEKVKRASSLEELSRTKLEDLTAPRPPEREREREREHKPERRSWGDDYRAPAPPPAADAPELTDFQTVTKRRKARRRPDEPEREPPRRRAPSPLRARRPSAPPSERSNDSDEPEGAQSPGPAPAPAPPPPAPHASYADIARTRHNIPDLIESCNFYAEGEGEGEGAAPPPAADAHTYPALGGGRARGKGGRARPKERPAPCPDVLGERRPAVILAAGGRARDLDGVTFGFDVNEQLLGGRACDLLRDAEDGAVRVRLRSAAPLLYRPPRPPTDTAHLHQIIDYVAHAWEDVVRCGGKARYYSE